MHKYIKLKMNPAPSDDEMLANFACHGRQQYRGAGGGTPSGLSPRPYRPPGETHNDWSWKPSLEVRAALSRGQGKCAPPAFDQYLAALTPEERGVVLTNKHNYESGFGLKIQPLERVFNEQMEGWSESSNRDALGAVSLNSSRL